MLIDLVICNLVLLCERPGFISIANAVFAIGTSIGPFVGGALAQNQWRWVFYLNVPIGVVSLTFLFVFLNVTSTKQTLSEILRRFDFIGSFLSIPSTVAILFALNTTGAVHPRSSWRDSAIAFLSTSIHATFNHHFSQHVNEITNPQVREVFSGGNAYEHGNKAFITSLDPTSQWQVVHVFARRLTMVWTVGMVLCVVNFLPIILEKSIDMRKELNSKVGLEDRPYAKSLAVEEVKRNGIASSTV
ncbi:uncharacterized protein A1O9_02224 [Exophiala aquamarina CBS 119918]|uniref:Major facilitator superfamily (MFS) profile domain-containing protein n=1 Tax=Exophiala aquamarina CBS 119918 TaxID=1182545 RepID=A0A072PMU7_9EURO|nr:uncharacterized protein A1O9_02224 [Exophiala aquamarina CBS 119918]KEF60663.1 hypothetical protein A1O9_02224 [Exophiala aquamarina CBS 119918]